MSQEPAVETRCFVQIVLCNYLGISLVYFGGNTGDVPPLHAEHGVHLSFTCTGKNTQKIKRLQKFFSAFWSGCTENPRNLRARMCIDKSRAHQATASIASLSPFSCIKPNRRTRHQPPLKKKGAVQLPCCRAAPQAQLSRVSTVNHGLKDLVSAGPGLRFLVWGRKTLPHPATGSLQSCMLLHHFHSHFLIYQHNLD